MISEILGVKTLQEIENRKWYKQFANMHDFHQQPWLNRAIMFLEQNARKWDILQEFNQHEQSRIFLCLAAGLWARDWRVDYGGLTAVKMEDPPATGYLESDNLDGVVVVLEPEDLEDATENS